MQKYFRSISLPLAVACLTFLMAALWSAPRVSNISSADGSYYAGSGYQPGGASPHLYYDSSFSTSSYGYNGSNYSSSSGYNSYDGASYATHSWSAGQISYHSLRRLGNLCMYSVRVQWNTQGVHTAYITVRDPDTGAEKVFASGTSGNQEAPWIAANKTYRFTLWNMDNGQRWLAETYVYVGGRCDNYGAGHYYPGGGYGGNQHQSAAVSSLDNYFSPRTITVPAGTTVTWTNQGMLPHTVTADDGRYDSGIMNRGATFQYTFAVPGTYQYYCRLHGAPGGVGMAGTVIVTGDNRY